MLTPSQKIILEQASFLHTLLKADGNEDGALCVEDIRSDLYPTDDGDKTAEEVTTEEMIFDDICEAGKTRAEKLLGLAA